MTAPRRSTRLLVLTAIVVSLVGCDQATKFYAVENLQNQPPQSYLGDVVRVHFVKNKGAFLGLMGGLDSQVRFWALTVTNAVILSWVGAYVLYSRKLDRWMFVALALIVAGGIGNLIDRVRLEGEVIDFLNVGVGERAWQRTGVFNVADVAITAGFFMLLPLLFRSEPKDDTGPESAVAS